MAVVFTCLRQGTDKSENIPDKRSIIPYRLLLQFTGRENFILAMDRWFREFSDFGRDEKKQWSNWIWAMVPDKRQQTRNVEKRQNNHLGYRNADLDRELQRAYNGECGIYEFAVKREDGEISVVYVGCTCIRNDSSPSLQDRIVDYTKHGNHKKNEINEALRRGYTLLVRFKPAQDRREAKRMENELLDKYNYAWNVRNNGVRPILAAAEEWK